MCELSHTVVLAERPVQLDARPLAGGEVCGSHESERPRLGARRRRGHDHPLAQLQGAAGVRGLHREGRREILFRSNFGVTS